MGDIFGQDRFSNNDFYGSDRFYGFQVFITKATHLKSNIIFQ